MIRKAICSMLVIACASLCANDTGLPVIAHWSFDKETKTKKGFHDSGSHEFLAELESKDSGEKNITTKGIKGDALQMGKKSTIKYGKKIATRYDIKDSSKNLNLTPPFTVCAWVKFKDKSKSVCILNKKLDSANDGYDIRISWNNLEYRWGDGNNSYLDRAKNYRMEAGKWYHVAVSNDGKNITLFINAEPVFSKKYENAAPAPSKQELALGGYSGRLKSFYNYKGAIDEVYLIGKALNKDELFKLSDFDMFSK